MSDPWAPDAVVIYTDGACRGNPGPGGWGALLIAGERRRELNGSESQTTNNRMELLAAIEALTALRKPQTTVALYTDSQYLRKGVLEWMKNWKRNGWRTAAKQPVKNRDLWERLDQLLDQHVIEWHWVKGHAGDPGNERADALANDAIDAMLEQASGA